MIVKTVEFDWNPNYSIFASRGFLQSVSDQFGWIGGFDHGGKMVCILPYTIIKKGPVKMARFRVETIKMVSEFTKQQETEFLNLIINILRKLKVDVIIPASTNCIFRTYPEKAKAAPYGSHIIELNQTEEILWKNIHQKHRNVIRNAEKKGVKIVEGPEYLEVAYNLIKETFQRSKMKLMNFSSFKKMINGLGNFVKIMVAEHDGSVQACAVIPFSLYRAYYLYGGTATRPLTGSMNYLQWRSIIDFKLMGVQSYDFCGARIAPDKDSKAARLIMYKERFGGKLHVGYMWKYSINPIKSFIYNFGVKILRGGDIVDAEHHKLSLFRFYGSDEIEKGN
ncbi:MAG: peptidoglycan bridge formation glycyltransferase FemA/FemB family protein [Candidatus Aminicenantes bacterium]|nr:peptidoglycan bridge formation glycyltransferase FemA/FemB family protein [Candidatus Aminicenantes bacterium]